VRRCRTTALPRSGTPRPVVRSRGRESDPG